MRVIKNINGTVTVNFHYKPKQDIVIKPKHSFSSDDDEMIDRLLQTFGFLVEITPKKVFPVRKPRKARGVKPKR